MCESGRERRGHYLCLPFAACWLRREMQLIQRRPSREKDCPLLQLWRGVFSAASWEEKRAKMKKRSWPVNWSRSIWEAEEEKLTESEEKTSRLNEEKWRRKEENKKMRPKQICLFWCWRFRRKEEEAISGCTCNEEGISVHCFLTCLQERRRQGCLSSFSFAVCSFLKHGLLCVFCALFSHSRAQITVPTTYLNSIHYPYLHSLAPF